MGWVAAIMLSQVTCRSGFVRRMASPSSCNVPKTFLPWVPCGRVSAHVPCACAFHYVVI